MNAKTVPIEVNVVGMDKIDDFCEQIAIEVAALQQMVAKLKRYVTHDDDCYLRGVKFECTCGLWDLIPELIPPEYQQ